MLKIYDESGKEVTTLINEKQNAGKYSVDWDAGNYASGIYFYRLEGNNFVQTKRMALVK